MNTKLQSSWMNLRKCDKIVPIELIWEELWPKVLLEVKHHLILILPELYKPDNI